MQPKSSTTLLCGTCCPSRKTACLICYCSIDVTHETESGTLWSLFSSYFACTDRWSESSSGYRSMVVIKSTTVRPTHIILMSSSALIFRRFGVDTAMACTPGVVSLRSRSWCMQSARPTGVHTSPASIDKWPTACLQNLSTAFFFSFSYFFLFLRSVIFFANMPLWRRYKRLF